MSWKPLVALVLGACARDAVTAPDAPSAPAISTAISPEPARVSVIMSQLDSPRGLAWGPGGALYIAEAGSNVASTTCATVARGTNCYSGTGAITRLWHGRQQRVVTGLPSFFNAAANDIGGPQDIGFGFFGIPHVTIGWGAAPDARAALGALGRGFGSLLTVLPNGRWVVASDVSQFEAENNPARAGGTVQPTVRTVRGRADVGLTRPRRESVCQHADGCAVPARRGGDLSRRRGTTARGCVARLHHDSRFCR